MPLFGRPKKQNETPESAMQGLGESISTLEKREKHLEQKAEEDLQRARQYMKSGEKQRALHCLKRKKVYEAQMDKLSKTRFSIEQQLLALEDSSMNVQALDAMKAGSEKMRALQKDMGVDDVEETVDEIEDAMTVASEISDALSRPMGDSALWSGDDDDLFEELDQLAEEDVANALLAVGDGDDDTEAAPVAVAVAAPTPAVVVVDTTPAQAPDPVPVIERGSGLAPRTKEEEEFAALEASMNML